MRTSLLLGGAAPVVLEAFVCLPHASHPVHAFTQALLRVRYSSPLFRMARAEDIQAQLRFFNTGPDQVRGADGPGAVRRCS